MCIGLMIHATDRNYTRALLIEVGSRCVSVVCSFIGLGLGLNWFQRVLLYQHVSLVETSRESFVGTLDQVESVQVLVQLKGIMNLPGEHVLFLTNNFNRGSILLSVPLGSGLL